MDKGIATGYKRLPGRGPRRSGLFSGLVSRCSLYLARDHILSVENQSFSEDYKRFYFSDIQAIVLRRTRRWSGWNIAFPCIIGLAVLLMPHRGSAGIFFWVLCGICVLLLLINILRGPTCVCHIVSAVQEEQLPSLNRVRVARRVIARLKETIEAVQGTLNLQDIEIGRSRAAAAPAPLVRESRQLRGNARRMHHYDATMHMIAFGLMLADAILTGFLLLHHSMAVTAVSLALYVAYSVCIVIALAKQHGSDIPRAVRGITWASLGFVCLSLILSQILTFATFTSRPRKHSRVMSQWEVQSEMYRSLFSLSPMDSPLVMALYIFSAVCLLGLGVFGLVTVKRYRDDFSRATR